MHFLASLLLALPNGLVLMYCVFVLSVFFHYSWTRVQYHFSFLELEGPTMMWPVNCDAKSTLKKKRIENPGVKIGIYLHPDFYYTGH